MSNSSASFELRKFKQSIATGTTAKYLGNAISQQNNKNTSPSPSSSSSGSNLSSGTNQAISNIKTGNIPENISGKTSTPSDNNLEPSTQRQIETIQSSRTMGDKTEKAFTNLLTLVDEQKKQNIIHESVFENLSPTIVNKSADLRSGQRVEVTWEDKQGNIKTTNVEASRLKNFENDNRHIVEMRTLQGNIFYDIPTSSEYQSEYESELRSRYSNSGYIPQSYRRKVDAPSDLKDQGLISESEYENISYMASIGLISEEEANKKLSDIVSSRQTVDWYKEYGTFKDSSGKDVSWKELKKDEPAVYLEKTSSGVELDYDPLRWQREEHARAEREGDWGFLAGEFFSSVFSPERWEYGINAITGGNTPSYVNMRDIDSFVKNQQEQGNRILASGHYEYYKQYGKKDYLGMTYRFLSSPFPSVGISYGIGTLFGAGTAAASSTSFGGKSLFTIGKNITVTPANIAAFETGVAMGSVGVATSAPVYQKAFETGDWSKAQAHGLSTLFSFGAGFAGYRAGYSWATNPKTISRFNKGVDNVRNSFSKYKSLKNDLLLSNKKYAVYRPKSFIKLSKWAGKYDSSMTLSDMYVGYKVKYWNVKMSNIVANRSSSNVLNPFRNVYKGLKTTQYSLSSKYYQARFKLSDYDTSYNVLTHFRNRGISSPFKNIYKNINVFKYNTLSKYYQFRLNHPGFDTSKNTLLSFRNVYKGLKTTQYGLSSRVNQFRLKYPSYDVSSQLDNPILYGLRFSKKLGFDTSKNTLLSYRNIISNASKKYFSFKAKHSIVFDITSSRFNVPGYKIYGRFSKSISKSNLYHLFGKPHTNEIKFSWRNIRPGNNIRNTGVVFKNITPRKFADNINIQTGGSLSSIQSFKTVSSGSFRMPSGYAIASGGVSLGFLRFLEEGTNVINPKWDTFKKNNKSIIGLDTSYSINSINKFDIGLSEKTIPDISSEIKPKYDFDVSNKNDLKFNSLLGNYFDSGLDIKPSVDTSIKNIQSNLQSQTQFQILDYSLDSQIVSNKFKFLFDFDISNEGKNNLGKKIDPGQGFNVFVKDRVYVKGKKKYSDCFVKMNKKPLNRMDALSLGGSIVDNSAAATFKITRTKGRPGKPSIVVPSWDYLSGKFDNKNGLYIEPSRHRIDTSGEVRGISARGWIAERRKQQKNTKPVVKKTRIVSRSIKNDIGLKDIKKMFRGDFF